MTLLAEIPGRALAVYAHPDDPEVSCGGTLAHWATHGAEVRLSAANVGRRWPEVMEAEGIRFTVE